MNHALLLNDSLMNGSHFTILPWPQTLHSGDQSVSGRSADLLANGPFSKLTWRQYVILAIPSMLVDILYGKTNRGGGQRMKVFGNVWRVFCGKTNSREGVSYACVFIDNTVEIISYFMSDDIKSHKELASKAERTFFCKEESRKQFVFLVNGRRRWRCGYRPERWER